MHLDGCEPWGYVAPVVAAGVTRATGVRHIYLIAMNKNTLGVSYTDKSVHYLLGST